MPPTNKLLQKFTGSLARSSMSNFVGQVSRVGLQAAYFVILARVLGVDGFGAFSGVVAIAAVVGSFSSLGVSNLLLREVVLDPGSRKRSFATALLVTAFGGTVAVGFILAASTLILPDTIPLFVIAFISIGDILGVHLAEICLCLFAAFERQSTVAVCQFSLYGSRLLAAIFLWAFKGGFGLHEWAIVYCLTTVAVVAIMVLYSVGAYGIARPDLRTYRKQYKQGLLFSVGLAAQSVHNDIDKAMLAQFSTLSAVGIYTAAYRIVDMTFTPVRAIMAAAYPRFFRHGAEGLSPALQFGKKILRPSIIYCAVAAVAVLLTAPLAPVVLGAEYDNAVNVIRALSLLPLLKAIQYVAANTLTGAGMQGRRSSVQVLVALVNVGLNVPMISLFGYWGAVWTSYACDGLLTVALWGVVLESRRRLRESEPDAGDERIRAARQSISARGKP